MRCATEVTSVKRVETERLVGITVLFRRSSLFSFHVLSYAPHIMVCMDVWSKAKQA